MVKKNKLQVPDCFLLHCHEEVTCVKSYIQINFSTKCRSHTKTNWCRSCILSFRLVGVASTERTLSTRVYDRTITIPWTMQSDKEGT